MRSSFRCAGVWVIALALLAATGCQQGVYRASSLPPELAAAAIPHVNSFDLTRLGAAPVNSELIYPTDALKVTVSTGIEDDTPPGSDLMVSRDGTIAVPVIGTVHVAGLSLAEAAEAIRQEGMRRDIYRDPTVALAFGVRAMNRITVDGAVEKPGTYELPAGSSTLSAALAAAGGLNKEATRFVEIQYPTSRGPAGGMEVNQVGYHPSDAARNSVGHDGLVRVDIFEAQYSPGGAASLNHYLRDGAVVTVVQTPPRFVTVMGQTGNRVLALAPERETRMLDAIAEVGGPKYSIWIADKVKVFRRVPGSDETITIAASMRRAKKDSAENLLLTSGDMVSVEENPLTFTMDTVSKLLGVGVAATQAAYYGL